jgi:hypothetical protein
MTIYLGSEKYHYDVARERKMCNILQMTLQRYMR